MIQKKNQTNRSVEVIKREERYEVSYTYYYWYK